jgi:hypothetical protein
VKALGSPSSLAAPRSIGFGSEAQGFLRSDGELSAFCMVETAKDWSEIDL